MDIAHLRVEQLTLASDAINKCGAQVTLAIQEIDQSIQHLEYRKNALYRRLAELDAKELVLSKAIKKAEKTVNIRNTSGRKPGQRKSSKS